jgi:hypothetical protein
MKSTIPVAADASTPGAWFAPPVKTPLLWAWTILPFQADNPWYGRTGSNT